MVASPNALAVDIDEAGARLGVSRSTVYRLRKDGVIHSRLIRGRAVILVADLEDYVERLRGEQCSRPA